MLKHSFSIKFPSKVLVILYNDMVFSKLGYLWALSINQHNSDNIWISTTEFSSDD